MIKTAMEFVNFILALLQGAALLGMCGSFFGASVVGYWLTDTACTNEESYRYREFRRKAFVVFAVSLILYMLFSLAEIGV